MSLGSTPSKAAALLAKPNSVIELSDIYTEREVTTLIEMMGAGRFPSLRRVVRVALNRYAQHLQIGAPEDVFLE